MGSTLGRSIDVWVARFTDVPEASSRHFASLLGDPAPAAFAPPRGREIRHRASVSRMLLRAALSQRHPVAPVEWNFARDAGGRPRIDMTSDRLRTTDFNMTHTRTCVVVAVGKDCRLGVDAEDMRSDVPVIALAERFFHPDETAGLRALSGRARMRQFFRYWTLKEACLKARGEGMAQLKQLPRFILARGRRSRPGFQPGSAPAGPAWGFRQFWIGRRLLVALCASSARMLDRVRVRKVVPVLQDGMLSLVERGRVQRTRSSPSRRRGRGTQPARIHHNRGGHP